jgi:hypothetical protein
MPHGSCPPLRKVDTLSIRFWRPDKNPFANTASHAQGQSEQARVAGNASFQRRQAERYGACEDKYQRCTRSCSVPDKAGRGS